MLEKECMGQWHCLTSPSAPRGLDLGNLMRLLAFGSISIGGPIVTTAERLQEGPRVRP